MPYGRAQGIQGYNIEATPTPYPFAMFAPMVLGAPVENKMQEWMLRRGVQGKSLLSLGNPIRNRGGFAQHLQNKGLTKALDAARSGSSATRLEPFFRKFLKTTRKTNLGQSMMHSMPYGKTMLLTDALIAPMRIAQNEARKNKLIPRAAQYGSQVARSSPTLQIKGASMEKRALNAGGLGVNIAGSVAGSVAAGLLIQQMNAALNKRKREGNIGVDWQKLISRYPEFNKEDPSERDKVMDIFEGLHTMSPEVAAAPVLAAPVVRNAIEYGMQGFSPADMKTLTDINAKMTPQMDPSATKMLPKNMDFASAMGWGNDGDV